MNFFPTTAAGMFSTPLRRRRDITVRGWPFRGLDELLEWAGEVPASIERRMVLPVDVEETEKEYVVKVDAVGIEKDKIEVTLEDKMLSISYKELKETEKKDKNYLLKERFEGSSSRTIELPEANSQGTADAQVKDGLLTIKIAKGPSTTTTRVPVR